MNTIKSILPNGLTVITNHNENAVSTMLTFWAKAGGNNEKNYPYGIAHFLEHMMFKGTKNRNKHDIKEHIDEIGGLFNATTWSDKTRYYTVVPFDNWKIGVDVLTDMMFNSLFPEDEIEKEKKVVLEEIKRSQDDPSGYAFRQLITYLMKERPERQSVLGSSESVSSITRDDLVRFVNEFYQPSNMVFVATGNINHTELCHYLTQLCPTETKEVDSKVGRYLPINLNGHTISFEKDIKQTHLRFAVLGVDGHHEDVYTLDVIGTLLGGSMSSRLFNLIREERGLAYSVSTGYSTSDDIGYMSGYVGTDPTKVEEVKSIIVEQFDRLKTEKVPLKELEKVKKSMIGSYLISQDYKEAINTQLAVEHMYGLVVDPKTYAECVNRVTEEDIIRVANTYFGADKFLFVEVGPKQI